MNNHLDNELNQLVTIDKFKKALLRHFNSLDRCKYMSGDDLLLKKRRINKYKITIKKYLHQLREDTNFKLESGKDIIRLSYSGKYVNTVRVVVLWWT